MVVGGGGRLYTYHYTVTTRMTPALRWAAMKVILMFHNCEGQSHKTMSRDHNLLRERRAEADSNRGSSAYQPNALPLGQTNSHKLFCIGCMATIYIPTTLIIMAVAVSLTSAGRTARDELHMRNPISPPPSPRPPPGRP